MRVTQSIAYRNFLSDIQSLNENANKVLREISSGKKLSSLRDSPSGSAQLVAIRDLQSRIDQYVANAEDGSYFLRAADSALNEVSNLITGIYAKGSQAAMEILSPDERSMVAGEIRSLRDQILMLANSQAKGRYIFAGSLVTTTPFAITGDTVNYQGDNDVNRVLVDDGLEISQGVSGFEVFIPIFSLLNALLSGLDAQNLTDIQNALDQFSSVLSGLGQIRGKIGANICMLESVQSNLDLRTIGVTEQKSRIEDADMAQAIVYLNQIQTSLDAALSSGGSLLSRQNLFDIIG